MAVRAPGFTRFDRWGANLGRLHVLEASHVEALDGTDELSLTCKEDLAKGDRVVWVDRLGTCREHVVDVPKRTHDDLGEPTTSATCMNSMCELWDDYVEDRRPSGGAQVAMAAALKGTRWAVGDCDQPGSASATLYHVSAREALAQVAKTWGGELEAQLETDGKSVTARRVGLRKLRGDQSSARRFTWTRDLESISRTVASDNPKTRVYGYGKGVETEGGGYGRRLTFADVNDGLAYVEDAEATKVWGHPDGSGGVAPSVGIYVNEQCTDAAQLLAETTACLEQAKEPKVSYEASVTNLAAYGAQWEDVGLGDSVAVVDREFSERGVRLRARVSKVQRDLLTGETKVTFGNVTDAMSDMWASVSQALQGSAAQRAAYDAVALVSPGWLKQLQAGLNDQFDKAGSYRVETFELGTIWSNVPLDGATGRPVSPAGQMWAINVSGRGFRIASRLKADGSWDWTTFGTGEGFTADAINAGTLNANLIRAGVLSDATGDNYWDLASGELRMSGYAGTSEAVRNVDVEYALSDSPSQAPTGGWSTTAPTWMAKRYMWQRTKVTAADGTVTYSEPTCIQGAAGADGKDGAPGKDGSDGLPGPAGKDGAPSYFHVKYAPNATPDASQMSEAPQAYIGTYVDSTQADSTDPAKYAWVRIEGVDGRDGTDGAQGLPGTDGRDGTTYYLHIAYADSADGRTGFSTTDAASKWYMGTCVDTEQQDPTDPARYSWSLIRGADGQDGTDGAPGPAGKDGASTYFHRAYATSADGKTGFSTTSAAGKTYLGTYVDSTKADSTDPSKYAWSLIKGADGAQGVPGTSGRDGTTYYLHIAYATSADGTQGFSTTVAAGKTHIGQCVDTAQQDPTDPARYSWSLIKGADGKDGQDGSDGVSATSITEQYYLSTSKSAQEGGSWQDTCPSWVEGRWYWTRSRVTWSDGTTTYTTPVLAGGLNDANRAAFEAKVTAVGLELKVTDLDGNVSKLEQTSQGITNTVSALSGEVTKVKQTAQGLETRIENVAEAAGDEAAARTALIRLTSAGVEVGQVNASDERVGPYALVSSAGSFDVCDKSGTTLSSFSGSDISLLGRTFTVSTDVNGETNVQPRNGLYVIPGNLGNVRLNNGKPQREYYGVATSDWYQLALGRTLLWSGSTTSGGSIGTHNISFYVMIEVDFSDGSRLYKHLFTPKESAGNMNTSLSRVVSNGTNLYIGCATFGFNPAHDSEFVISNNVQMTLSPGEAVPGLEPDVFRVTEIAGWR